MESAAKIQDSTPVGNATGDGMRVSRDARQNSTVNSSASITPSAHGKMPQDMDLSNPITFWRGRVALYAILKVLGVGTGDAVIVPGYTCFAVPSAVLFTGAEAIYADIDPSTFAVTRESLEQTTKAHPKANVKAVIVQHTYGIPAETAPIVAWAHERGVFVIEDCAHVWGSTYLDESGNLVPVGTLGDAAFFSSQWTKPVSTGLGGWVVTRNPELSKQLRKFRAEECAAPSLLDAATLCIQVSLRSLLASPRIYAAAKAAYQFLYSRGWISGTSSKEELQGTIPSDYAKQMSGFQERLLKKRFRQQSLLDYRKKLKQIYDSALKEAGMAELCFASNSEAVLLRYPVRLSRKTEALQEAKRRGVELGDWYSQPIDGPESLSVKSLGYTQGFCPEGERAGRTVVNLPMDIHVTENSAREMVHWIKTFA